MPVAYLFWGFYIATLFLGWWTNYDGQPLWQRRAGVFTILMILIGFLGYHVFGHPIQ